MLLPLHRRRPARAPGTIVTEAGTGGIFTVKKLRSPTSEQVWRGEVCGERLLECKRPMRSDLIEELHVVGDLLGQLSGAGDLALVELLILERLTEAFSVSAPPDCRPDTSPQRNTRQCRPARRSPEPWTVQHYRARDTAARHGGQTSADCVW